MLTFIAGSLTRTATAVLTGKNATLISLSDVRANFYITIVDVMLTEASQGN